MQSYDSIDTVKGTARIIANSGAAEMVVWDAPKSVPVHRHEIFERIKHERDLERDE
jgi:sRNA-binding carbon storage regulator CsrA